MYSTLGKRGLFVEKLFALEGGQEAIQFVFGLGDHLADQTQRELAANDGELLEQGFLVWREAVDAGGEDALHGGRKMQVACGRGSAHAVPLRASRTNTPCSSNSWTISSMKNGVPSVFSKMSCLRACRGVVSRAGRPVRSLSPSSTSRNSSASALPNGRQPQLRVIRLLPPLVAVLGAVVHEQQDLGGGDTLAEDVEKPLRLAVNPMEVLKDQDQRLVETLAEEQSLERLEGAAAANLRVHLL